MMEIASLVGKIILLVLASIWTVSLIIVIANAIRRKYHERLRSRWKSNIY